MSLRMVPGPGGLWQRVEYGYANVDGDVWLIWDEDGNAEFVQENLPSDGLTGCRKVARTVTYSDWRPLGAGRGAGSPSEQ